MIINRIQVIAITAIALVTFVPEFVGEEYYVQDAVALGEEECDTDEQREQDVCIGIGKKYEKGYAYGRQIDASLWCFSLPLAFIVSSPSKQKALLDLFRRIRLDFIGNLDSSWQPNMNMHSNMILEIFKSILS